MVYFSQLIWDDWNEEHIARHRVEADEAAEAVRNAAFMVRSRNGSYITVGPTDAGRPLFIVLAPREGRAYYVVTARDATLGEQRRFNR